jgi:hypothetical protein
VDFEDLAKDFTVNGNDISLNIKIHLCWPGSYERYGVGCRGGLRRWAIGERP